MGLLVLYQHYVNRDLKCIKKAENHPTTTTQLLTRLMCYLKAILGDCFMKHIASNVSARLSPIRGVAVLSHYASVHKCVLKRQQVHSFC